MRTHQTRKGDTHEQTSYGKLREVLPGHHLDVIITLALVTGMRRDELLHLKWQDIDLEKRELQVYNTKTKSGHRMIHVPQDVTKMLKQHRIRQMEARLEAGQAWPHLDLVFPNHTGGFLRPDQLVKGFYEILEQAELPRIRFHALREARWRALIAQ